MKTGNLLVLHQTKTEKKKIIDVLVIATAALVFMRHIDEYMM